MARIYRKLITIPTGVTVSESGNTVLVSGPNGKLSLPIPREVRVLVSADGVTIAPAQEAMKRREAAVLGTIRQLVANMVRGVTVGYQKSLELVGTGYRVSISGSKLTLVVGFSHPIDYTLPAGVTGKVEKNTITISGPDKQVLGEAAAQIRRIRKPEPYKGIGIRYTDEKIRRKAGKQAKAGAK